MYSTCKFLPVSVKCALYPNSCPCLWSVLYSNLAFACALCTIFTVTDNLSASSEHADNGAALLLRVLVFFFFFRSRTMERVLKVWCQHLAVWTWPGNLRKSSSYWAWWCRPLISAIWESEAGGSQESHHISVPITQPTQPKETINI